MNSLSLHTDVAQPVEDCQMFLFFQQDIVARPLTHGSLMILQLTEKSISEVAILKNVMQRHCTFFMPSVLCYHRCSRIPTPPLGTLFPSLVSYCLQTSGFNDTTHQWNWIFIPLFLISFLFAQRQAGFPFNVGGGVVMGETKTIIHSVEPFLGLNKW